MSDTTMPKTRLRAWLLWLLPVLVVGLLATHVWRLKDYAPPAPTPKPERATILDRNGNVLAANTPAVSLWMDPTVFLAPCDEKGCVIGPNHQARVARLLDALTDTPTAQAIVRDKLASARTFLPTQHFVYLAYNLPLSVVDTLKPLALPGIAWQPVTKRIYPKGPLFAHAIGFTMKDPSGNGLDGLEWVANAWLTGRQTDKSGRPQPLLTTLDSGIQAQARAALLETLRKHRVDAGAVVVADARTGAVLAMASAPDFDPNDDTTFRNPLREDRILNHAVADAFPLEGLLAPLLVAQALNEHVITPETRIAHGSTVAELTRNPTATATATLLREMPAQALYTYLDRLGFGLDLRMPGISPGVYNELADWRDWTPAMQASLGQHVHANMMQILQAYQPIAGDGLLRRLHLIAGPDTDACPMGDAVSNGCARQGVLRPETAATLRRLMAAGGPHATIVTLSSPPPGHARPGIRAIRIGMTPADAPRYLVGVLLHHRTGNKKDLMPAATTLFNTLMDQLDRPRDRAFACGLEARPDAIPTLKAQS